MQIQTKLLRLLNHRHYLTGTILARKVGSNPSDVRGHIASLRHLGLPVEHVPGRGYKLSPGIVVLRDDEILNNVGDPMRTQIDRVLVEQSVDSTSSCLRRLSTRASIHGVVCIAESQTSGRGRRGNHWQASPYRNLIMSLGWVYATWPQAVTGLAIAIGLGLKDALSEIGAAGLGVKWPNDIVRGKRKLGGILIDVSGDSSGPCTLIIGVGINVSVLESDASLIDQPWVDLTEIVGRSVDRNELAGICISHMVKVLSRFEKDGFEGYRQRWPEVDVLSGREVSVMLHKDGDSVQGTVIGLDGGGALKIRKPGGDEMTCYHGEVSVRRQ